ncbi:MarR family winged helix-turn-helix transcriptional regulator [Actinomadura kijaniata]|uniref:MarR family winged helix-turn-helix transcriptional regulator n=1 Tax=Actinomadura kijaniata TaxID=46161 RepID=UPI003F1BE933
MKPIGYWLNRADQAITARMDDALAAHGLTRVGWQILNVAEDGATDAEVLSALAANADAPTLTGTVGTLLADGWLTRPAPDRLALTDRGRERMGAVAERVREFRELSTAGISPEEYRTTVDVLERLTRNLEEPGATA